MPVRCRVKGCNRNFISDKKHSFFRQPQNPVIRKKWLEFAGVEGNPSHFRVCLDHFDSKDIRKWHPRPLLVRDAVPTILTPSSHDVGMVKDQPKKIKVERSSQETCSHTSTGTIPTILRPSSQDVEFMEDQPKIIEVERSSQETCSHTSTGTIPTILRPSSQDVEFMEDQPKIIEVERSSQETCSHTSTGTIPTILRPSSQDVEFLEDQPKIIEVQRSSQETCSHTSTGMIVDIKKAQGDKPAIIHIQSNDDIRIIISGKKCTNCKE